MRNSYKLIKFSSSHSNSTEFVALILARGGSKGIPRKNLAPIGGVSLLARSIQTIQRANVFKEIWVSTDDDEISSEAMKCEYIDFLLRFGVMRAKRDDVL